MKNIRKNIHLTKKKSIYIYINTIEHLLTRPPAQSGTGRISNTYRCKNVQHMSHRFLAVERVRSLYTLYSTYSIAMYNLLFYDLSNPIRI